jgi:hypothetical protein
MDLEPQETTLPKMGLFTVTWAYYRQLLKLAIPRNPNITSLEEIDNKVGKNASKLYHTFPPRDPDIPDLAEVLRRKRKAMENMNRAAGRRQHNIL